MKILTIFISSINKYGIKFLFFILIFEFLNIYRFRLDDYILANPISKKNEPSVPTPYFCLNIIKKKLFNNKFVFIDFGCGKGRVIDFFKNNSQIKKIIGIENNINLKKKLSLKQNNKIKFYFEDCKSSVFINFLSKKFENEQLVLYFFHPFSEKVLNKIIKVFLRKNFKKIKIIILGKIIINSDILKKYKLKTSSLHRHLNIYDYKNH